MLYTIKQASVKLNVSRQSIYNKIDSPELQDYLQDGEKGKLIEEKGLEVLSHLIKVKMDSQNDSPKQKENVHLDKDLTAIIQTKDEYITALKEQIEHMKSQLQQKDEQISSLSRLLENSQILLKREQDKILALESEDQKKKRSFLQRLFNR